ncbi:MAG: [FeFe] hydrogenase H-cluster radical SAM maturase HydG [Desulfobulbaceae bacterium]|nr:[FeFe] hydrogenase H-cluster radical SAM maturase HydG [Desulfobulbaceae bacterium]
MEAVECAHWLQEEDICHVLARKETPSKEEILEILAKARELQGLSLQEVAALSAVTDPALLHDMFATARAIKDEIYGRRLVLFAPLYMSNYCQNECLYCAFRKSNRELKRHALSQEEIADNVRILIRQGHKRLLLVAGESYPHGDFNYILDAIDTVYATREGASEIRRVNANIAPLSVEQFKSLKARGIGTYQLFQETYHRPTYARVHVRGAKANFDWRATALDRAMQAGIDDVGMGVLFGLYDWRFEILALLQHITHLEQRFGVGSHTISVPRIEPASGSEMSSNPPHMVDDLDFRKIVAILRMAVPYTGIIMSTRETKEMRRETLELGVSQISAGSRTDPGGYQSDGEFEASQFQLGDHRPLAEVIEDISQLGYIPSFCTGCYRLGRTGKDFMDMAKPGLIKEKCGPNALSTFKEYLRDYASPELAAIGTSAIDKELAAMLPKTRALAERMLEKVDSGKSDVYC